MPHNWDELLKIQIKNRLIALKHTGMANNITGGDLTVHIDEERLKYNSGLTGLGTIERNGRDIPTLISLAVDQIISHLRRTRQIQIQKTRN